MSDSPDKSRFEVIQGEDPAAESRSSAERRRVPRLNLSTEQFRHRANGKVFPVSDLSHTGMALRIIDANDLVLFPVGARFSGALNLKRVKHEVSARVCHVGKDLIGCEFENLSREASGALNEMLDPEALGRELRPIPASEPGMQWFRGVSGTHLMVWRGDDNAPRRFLLLVLGSFVQWETDEGVSTGRADHGFEMSEVQGALRFETLRLERDADLDKGKLSVAKTLIMSSNLPKDLKSWGFL